jgi:hypothetical protein
MKMLFGYCAVALLACMAFASPALAFAGSLGLTGGGGGAIIDIAPVVTAAVQIAATILFAFVGKFVTDHQARRYLHRAIELAVEYAIEAVHDLNWTKLSSRNELVALAVNYVIRATPGALKKFGIDRERLEDMVLARLFKHDPHKGVWEREPDEDDDGEAARRDGRGQATLATGASDAAHPVGAM